MSRYAEYANVSDLRNTFNKTSHADDAVLCSLLEAAGLAIDNFCKRPDGFLALEDATARYYPGSGNAYQWIDECTSVSVVAVKDSPSDDESDYVSWTVGTIGATNSADVFPATGDPEYPNFNTTPYTILVIGANSDYTYFTSGSYTYKPGFPPAYHVTPRGTATVKVTATWGYAEAVPQTIKTATMMQAARWYKRFESAMADVVADGALGQLLYRQELDPDVKMILVAGRYVKMSIGRR